MAPWECDVCGVVHEEPNGHNYIKHDVKVHVLQCQMCSYQDVVVDDFIAHVYRSHCVQIHTRDDAMQLIVAVPPFTRLCYCPLCGLRNVAADQIAQHRSHAHGIWRAPVTTTPVAATPTTSPSVTTAVAVAPPDASTTTTGAGLAAASEGDETLKLSVAEGCVSSLALTSSFSNLACSPSDDDARGADESDEKKSSDVHDVVKRDEETTCLLADEQFIMYAVGPDRVLFPDAEIPVVLHGKTMSTCWRVACRQRLLLFDDLLTPGYYEISQEGDRRVYGMEVAVHNQHPRRWTSTIAALEVDPMERSLSCLLLTCDSPAVVVAESYIDEVPEGVWEVRPCGKERVECRMEVKIVSEYR